MKVALLVGMSVGRKAVCSARAVEIKLVVRSVDKVALWLAVHSVYMKAVAWAWMLVDQMDILWAAPTEAHSG